MKALTYSLFYEPDFLLKFGEKAKDIGNILIGKDNKFFIDVYEVASILEIDIVEEEMADDSGRFDSQLNKIYVNSLEPNYRKRFTIAHEIGHSVLGHDGTSLRTEVLIKYKDTIEKSREVTANKFAAELLMPKKLIIFLILNTSKEKEWDTEALDNDQVESLTKIVAGKLDVSEISMRYAIMNNKIFVNGE